MVDLNTNYGDILLKEIENSFELIRLDGNNTDYDLEFLPGSSFQFTVETLKQRGFSHPEAMKITSEEQSDKDVRLYRGYYGAEDASSKISINQKSGFLNIYER